LVAPLRRLLRLNKLPENYRHTAPTRFLNRFAAHESGASLAIGNAAFTFEAGLAFVVTETCAQVDEDDGMDYIGGYLPALLLEDVSNPANHYLICGTYMPGEMCEDPYCREVSIEVDAVTIGIGDTDGLTHSLAALVHQASKTTPLMAGEMIFTGAAAGCSTASSNIILKAGNTAKIDIAGLGAASVQLS
ncbi:MAG: fumarylacetoacetate hydrolase family protein, partial [Alphaproteobacteria bacterium]